MPAKHQITSINDPVLKHKTEMKKVVTVANKAIVSTSLKEKNDLLLELQELFTPLVDSFEKYQKTIKIKNDELNGLKKKLNGEQSQKDTLQRNTAFYSHADQAKIKTDEKKLIDSIKDLEGQISRHHPLAYPDRLSDALKLPAKSDMRLFTLMDVNFRRIEELAYAYKKRLIVVEESQESTEVVLRDYGSINELINKVNDLESENQSLKTGEKVFIHDAVTRRRKFAQMTPITARNFVSAFKNLITGDKTVINSYLEEKFECALKDSDLDFDNVTTDDGFKTEPAKFEAADFGNTTEPEIIAPILEMNNPSQKVSAFKKVIDSIEATNTKLLSEIASIPNRYDVPQEGTLSRIEKIAEANERLLTRVHKISQNLDTKNVEVSEVSKQLNNMTCDRKKFNSFYVHSLGQYKRLVESHIDLVSKQSRNKFILQLLFKITSSFGEHIFLKEADDCEATKYVKSLYNELMRQLKESEGNNENGKFAQLDDDKSASNEQQPELVTAAAFHERLMAMSKKTKKLRHGTTTVSTVNRQSSSGMFIIESELEPDSPEETQQSINNSNNNNNNNINSNNSGNSSAKNEEYKGPVVFINRPRMEIMHGLAFAAELAGFAFGVDKKFKTNISEFVLNFLKEEREGIKKIIDNFGKPFSADISSINMCSNAILVKHKENVAMQTDIQPRLEIEIQTLQTGFAKPKAKPQHR